MKKFFVTSLTLILMLCGVFVAGCQKEYHYYIDDSDFSLVVALHDKVDDFDDLYICRVYNKEMVKTQVTASMIKSCDSTDTVGEKSLTIAYDGREFIIKFMVKYRVDFVVEDNVINSQLVLTPDEIEYPNNPTVAGVNFSCWAPTKPTELTDNFTFTALFALKEGDVPVPTTLSATYGDTLEGLTLRSNDKGSWQFVDDLSTTVGDAGTNEFEIKFVPTNQELVPPANRKVKINVQKKHVEFTNVSQSFVYDGEAKQPTFTLSVPGLKTEYYPEYSGDAINANSYDYEIEIKDKNYEGRLRSSFTIQKRVATIKIANDEINYTEPMPETYDFEVVDYQNNPLGDALIGLMGIEIIKPTEYNAGTYEVNARVANESNFDVTIEKGYLFINKIHYDLSEANPTFINNGNVTYGNFLNSVEINNEVEPNGWWAFEDNTLQVLSAKTFTTNVIYTSKDANYIPTTKQITLNVLQRPLQIDVVQNVYTYDGNPHTLVYEVKGVLSCDEQPAVFGNIQKTNAKTDGYVTTLMIDTDKYIAQTNATLTIHKAKQANFSTIYSHTWNDALQLQHISINSGYAWDEPTTVVYDIGLQGFNATFTPADTENFEIERGILKVDVTKAQAEIQTQENYTLTYSPNADDYILAGIFASHTESTLIYSYKYNGVAVTTLKDAGNYTINLTLPESTHYFQATKSFDVVINKVTNTDFVKTNVNSTYLDTLSQTTLPTNEFGEWTWSEGADCLVGNAGINYHTAIYTPNDTKNYHARQVEVTFNVAKRIIVTPTIAAQDYTGEILFADIQSTALYTVTPNNGDVEVGTYDVVLELTDSDNYVWSTSGQKSIVVNFEIKKNMNNDWINLPTVDGFTYGLGEVSSSASSIFGDVVITYANVKDPTNISTIKPTSAGTYNAIFTVADNKNYKGLTETKTFVILPQTVSAPTIISTLYTGEKLTADIKDAELYTISKNDGGIDVGTYDVVVTLKDPANYVWSTTNSGEDLTLDFVITQATNIWITTPKVTNINNDTTITYLDVLKLTAVPKFIGEQTITFNVKDSSEEPTNTQPVDAGTYTANFTIIGTDNFTTLTGSVHFTILPKEVVCPEIDSAVYDGKNKKTSLTSTDLYSVIQTTVDSQVIEQGYPVVFALKDKRNYIWAGGTNNDITRTFFITQNPNTWATTPAVSDIKYGETLNPIAVPQFGVLEEVTYTVKDNDTHIVPLNVNTYTAHFTVVGTTNYAGLTARVDFVIKPQVITAPEITPVFYSGENQKPNISNLEGIYTVVNNGGIDADTYDVIFTLEDYGNYIWSDETAKETLIVPFIINKNPVNDWSVTPAITSINNQNIIYGDEIKVEGAPTFGTLNDVQYKDFGADDSTLTTTQPTDAGNYTAVFSVTETNNYVGNIKYVDFTISPQDVIKPTINPKTYTGETLYADINPVGGVYSVAQSGGVVVTEQGYPVYVELLSNNYMWNGEDASVRQITLWFKIIPNESNEWTITPKVEGFTYGDGGAVVTKAEAKYGEVNILFKNRAIQGDTGSTTAPTDAGNYTAIFTVQGTESYSGLDAVSIDFVISPSIINAPERTSKVYNGSEQSANVSDGEYYKVTKNDAKVDAGVYYVEYTILDEFYGNYVWSGNINSKVASVEFEILKNETNNWKTSNTPKVTNANGEATIIYGDTVKATAQATYYHQEVKVTYAVKGSNDQPTTVAPNMVGEYTAYFVSAGNDNYNEVTASVDFVILPQEVVCPEDAGSKVYNTEKQTTSLIHELYTITQTEEAINVKEEGYSVTLSLKDKHNYIWQGSTNEDKIVKFYITQATNDWVVEPSVTNIAGETDIIYLDILKTTAQARFGEVNTVIYTIKGTNTLVTPEDVGEYTAHFSVNGTNNYTDIAYTVDLVILPQEVVCPEDAGSKVYNKNAQTTALSHELYNVTQAEEAINVKEEGYLVTLSLKDKHNYIWQGSTNEDKTVKFYITQATNSWIVEPSVIKALDMEYGDEIVFNKGETDFGEINVKYLNENKEEIAIAEDAGTYYMLFFVETDEHRNYTTLSKEIQIKINPKVVATPTILPKEYTGETLTATVPENQLYTVKTNDGGINVTPEGYDIVLELTNTYNYCWGRGDNSATTTLKFYITQSVNSWVTQPRINNVGKISYNDIVTTTAEAKHGTVSVTYTSSGSTNELSQPGDAGTYVVNFKVEGNANYTDLLDNSITITVYPRVVDIPEFNKELTYTGKAIAPEIADVEGDGYVVSSSSNVDAGTYTVTFTLENTTNFVWANDEGIQPQSVEYKINPAQDNAWSEMVPADLGWVYTQTPTVPVINTKYGTATAWFKFKDADDSTYTTIIPKNAGTYTAKFQDLGTKNYNATSVIVKDFTISKANAFVTAPTYAGVYYENIVDLSKDYTTAPALVSSYDEEIGTFTYTKWTTPVVSTSAAEYITEYCSVTYTPKDPENSNYLSYTYNNIPINIKLVAYIGSTYYGMVEKALKDAQSGNQVVIVPDTSGKVTIEKDIDDVVGEETETIDIEIKAGVELILPYKDGQNLVLDNNGGKARFNGDTLLNNLDLHTKLVVKSNVTLINRGKITVVGELSSGGGGAYMSSYTAGRYAKIELETNAHIESYGDIDCCGFIDETSKNNDSSVEMMGGTMYMPFILHDFRGGSYMLACNGGFFGTKEKYMPFNQWELRNVVSEITFYSGSFLSVYATLYANNSTYATSSSFIGNGNSFIDISSGGHITCKYDIAEGTSNRPAGTDKWNNGVMNINFYNGATVNSLSLSLAGYTVQTASFYFPISWRQSITFNSGTYTLSNKYKLLPGSKMVIEEGANVTTGEILVYSTFTDSCTTGGVDTQYGYDNIQGKVISRGPAVLIVNGSLTATTLAGNVKTTVSGEQDIKPTITVTNSSASAKEVTAISGSSFSTKVSSTQTISLSLTLMFGTKEYPVNSGNTKTTYTFNGVDWV